LVSAIIVSTKPYAYNNNNNNKGQPCLSNLLEIDKQEALSIFCKHHKAIFQNIYMKQVQLKWHFKAFVFAMLILNPIDSINSFHILNFLTVPPWSQPLLLPNHMHTTTTSTKANPAYQILLLLLLLFEYHY
jgi:hypothetical protein